MSDKHWLEFKNGSRIEWEDFVSGISRGRGFWMVPDYTNNKVLAISTLTHLRDDYILTEDEESIDKVINWLKNCTPDHEGEFNDT